MDRLGFSLVTKTIGALILEMFISYTCKDLMDLATFQVTLFLE